MSAKSAIEWTDATWNPVTGCTKISQGCKNCYAERDWARLSKIPGTVYTGRDFTDVRCHPGRLDQPLRWRKPRRIFVNSMSDLFHEAVPDDFIGQVFAVMARARQHIFQVLTKRPARMLDYLTRFKPDDEGYVTRDGRRAMGKPGNGPIFNSSRWPLPNVWAGVSAENQPTADERVAQLIQTPAAVRFISLEPLLSAIDLTRIDPNAESLSHLDALRGSFFCDGLDEPRSTPRLDWVIAGGESGPQARPSHPDFFRSIRDQCQAAGAPYFFKQWGEWRERADIDPKRIMDTFIKNTFMTRVGKKAAGRVLDGRTWDEYPDGTNA